MILDEEEHDYLVHYGILRRSGRYEWGSGETQNTRNKMFLDHVAGLRAQGLTEVEIAKGMGISTTELRAAKSVAKAQQKQSQIAMAQRLKDKGYSNGAIAERMNLPGESSVRALLAPGAKDKADILTATSDMLKREVDAKGLIDIGVGVEKYVGPGGISKEKLNSAVAMLKEEGYVVHTVKVKQLGTGHETNIKVLAPPGTTWGDVQRNRGEIKQIREFSDDGGRNWHPIQPPLPVHPDRVHINYAEDGGSKADGVIYVRPGVDDISLGASRYAQVRVQVGDGHYLKGMAVYKNDLPDGVDLVFNTNKSNTGNKLDAMKSLTNDPDLPFGSIVRQIQGKDGKPSSAMNIVNEEGQWNDWSKSIASQVLSKQQPSLAKERLGETFNRSKKDLDEINKLTNPTVKKKLLESYADSTDAAAVHLKAAALPRQASQVILPVNTMKPSEVYAPNYKDGERVMLIRYPHGGKFEIPDLVVNNRHPEAKRLLGDAKDAIGIHHSVAERLSGADFDGDTVLVIPNGHGKIKNSPALEGLKGFDPKKYKIPDDSPIPRVSADRMQTEMGKVSNLITDMTIRHASHEELARAVKHSMVVIDSHKHGLDVKRSAEDNNIKELKQKYQGKSNAGASTLISLASSKVRIPDRKPRPQSEGGPVDKETGRKIYVDNTSGGRSRLIKVERLAITDDAHDLSSGTPIEKIYADHSNRMKDLANQARLSSINTPALRYSPSAKKTYAEEVRSLDHKLTQAVMNAPRERQAQIVANAIVRAKREANPEMTKEERKKLEYAALQDTRARMGANKKEAMIEITDREWQAIQAGAISNNKLEQILTNTDLDRIRELATPRPRAAMSRSDAARARSLLNSGATRAEVAQQLGVSTSTLNAALEGE